jgi:hypothetical protein
MNPRSLARSLHRSSLNRPSLLPLVLWLWQAGPGLASPGRYETGLPPSPQAQEAQAPLPPEAPGQLHGDLGPLRIGFLGDLFATYRLGKRQDLLFHEFELSRIQATLWASYKQWGGGHITVDTVRSSGGRSYFGIEGDAILPRLKWAFAEATPLRHYLSLRAGLVPDLLLQYAEASWGYRVQGPIGLERDALYSPGDLGASVELALPFQLGSLAAQVANGEGLALREQNNGKNLTVALRIAPLRAKAPDLLVHALFRDGSLGAGSAADRRASLGLTYASPQLGAGAVGTLAFGYRGLGERGAAHLTAWLRGELPIRLGFLGRADVLWPDTAQRGSLQLRLIAGVSYALPALIRLIASYEGTLALGALSEQVPAIPEHALLLQAEVRI